MAPKGNSKAAAARDAKAEREAGKKAAQSAVKEAQEEETWQQGAKKNKGEDKAAKAAAALKAKEERERLLKEEEAALSAKKPTAQKGKQPPAKKPQPAGDSAGPSSGTGTPREVPSFEDALHAPIESFSASNIDDALELLSIVNQKNDKASEGSRAAQSLDAHPERRYKAALAAYKERELPIIKKEQPGLRLNQYEERIFKAFKKSPENPYNQATVAFNATKEEKIETLRKIREETENRLRESAA